jgi:hypothetical protein
MKVVRSIFTSRIVSLTFLGLLVLGIPVSGFSTEPHVCINNVIADSTSKSLGGVASYTFYFKANCGTHSSNTTSMKITVQKNVYPYPKLSCTGNTSTTEYPVPPDTYSVTCTSLPSSIRAVIDYHVVGSGPMSHTDTFTNP